ncbi:DUF6343 family protein [Planosporangium sp. 12N6]|uniref:DUF6343 family protein n=1 Tax=Planosporangium spinosum TaxID=3402278 RepID=UPI003CED82EF
MPIGAQPRGARGTVEHPYSALNLRMGLASCGFVVCTLLAVSLAVLGNEVLAALATLLAVIALVDLVVIQLRRRQARRSGPGRHSLSG